MHYIFVNTPIIAAVLLIFSSAAVLDSVPFVYDVYLGLPAEANAVSTDGMDSVHFVQSFGNKSLPQDLIPTPLQQAKDRVPADDVACNDDRVLMLSPSGSPACVFETSVGALEQRGFDVVIRPEPHSIPREVAAANNAFAVDFYKELAGNDGNIFFSPAGIYVAFSMLYEGVQGETADEIRDTFGLIEDDAARRQAMSDMVSSLNRHDPYSVLEISNSLWLAEMQVPQGTYADTARHTYGADIESANFADKDGAASRINEWADENTRGNIPKILDSEDVDDNTGAAMFSAAYFKGKWQFPLPPVSTYESDFWNGAENVTADFMSGLCGFRLTMHDDGVQVLRSPYENGRLSMLVVLPPEKDGIKNLEESLSAETLRKWQKNHGRGLIVPSLLKFDMRADYDLTPYLNSLGVKSVFSGGNPAGITEGVLVDKAIHSAYVEVDEEGFRNLGEECFVYDAKRSMPDFKADHPFIFFIQDNESGAILFMGRVMDPTK